MPCHALIAICVRWLPTLRGRASAWAVTGLAAMLLATAPLPAQAQTQTAEISSFDIVRNEEGVQLSFALRFELPRAVDDALQKGVPLYFVAEAEVFRDRWYWLDRRIGGATRTWRLAYQPLTRKYRVTFGGLNQSFDTLADALAGVRRISAWKLAEPGQIEDGVRHYVEFRYRLDTTLLPRPMQIGIGGQTEWTLQVEKTQRFN